MKTKEINEPTPNGGVRSVIYFFNDKHELVDEEYATNAIIHEYDAEGVSIFRTYGTFQKKAEKKSSD